jgi:hypothetical protein
MKIDAHKALIGYAGVVTVALAYMLVASARPGPRKAVFEEIDVQRLNVREPEGTLRMTLSSAARAPGIIYHNRERPHPDRKSAGLLFFNDEGTENGGLIFGGHEERGKVSNYGQLSFDQYDQDQVVQLIQEEENGERRAALVISDRPDQPLDLDALERARAMPEGPAKTDAVARAGGAPGAPRLMVGKTADRAAQISLRDADGRERLVLRVGADGAASIQFRDAAGNVVRTLDAASR